MLNDETYAHASAQLIKDCVDLRPASGSGLLCRMKLTRLKIWIKWLSFKALVEGKGDDFYRLEVEEYSTTKDFFVAVVKADASGRRFFIRKIRTYNGYRVTVGESPIPIEWEPLTPQSFEAYLKRLIDYRPIIQNNKSY